MIVNSICQFDRTKVRHSTIFILIHGNGFNIITDKYVTHYLYFLGRYELDAIDSRNLPREIFSEIYNDKEKHPQNGGALLVEMAGIEPASEELDL